MEELSKGFARSLYATFSRESSNAVNVDSIHKEMVELFAHEWLEPTLQIIDIQRFSKDVAECYDLERVAHNPLVASSLNNTELFSCFYLASSDGEGVVWVLIPPHSRLEEMISSFAVDVGYCMKLREYGVLIAANDRPVVVALEMSFSRNPLSLQGAPVFDNDAFHLSPHALQSTYTEMSSSSTLATYDKCNNTQSSSSQYVETHNNTIYATTTSIGKSPSLENIMRSAVEVDLDQLLQHPEYALSNWCLTLRLIWKGEDRAMERGSRYYRKMTCLESTNIKGNLQKQGSATVVKSNKSVNPAGRVSNKNKMELFGHCNCLMVDRNGDGIACTLYATVELLSEIDVDDCLQVVNPEIVWGTSSESAVSQLRIYERNIYCNLGDKLPGIAPAFPRQPSRFVGSAGNNIMSIASILAECGIDDVVSVMGKVIVVSDEVQVHTKRGRVMRRTISLEDLTQRGCMIDLTLWGNLASKAEVNEGEVWTVMDCTVREFMRRKTLSSRASTALTQMNANGLKKIYNTSADKVNSNHSEYMTRERQTTVAEGLLNNASTVNAHECTLSDRTSSPYNTHTPLQNTEVVSGEGKSFKNLDVSTPHLCIIGNTVDEQTPLLLRICEIGLCESTLSTLQNNMQYEQSTVHSHTSNIEQLQKLILESLIEITLSDGNCCLTTITQVSNVIALLDNNGCAEDDAGASVLQMCARLYETDNLSSLLTIINRELTGCAILAWVSHLEGSDTLTLTRCRHVNFAACAGVVLNEIDLLIRE